jgi:hypothetical protein
MPTVLESVSVLVSHREKETYVVFRLVRVVQILVLNRGSGKISQEACSSSRRLLIEVASLQRPHEVPLNVMRRGASGMSRLHSTLCTVQMMYDCIATISRVSGYKTCDVVLIRLVSICKRLVGSLRRDTPSNTNRKE